VSGPGLLETQAAKEFAVETQYVRLAQVIAGKAVAGASIAGFFGDPGTGKTFALRSFCAGSAVETVFITAAPRPGRKDIFEELLLATTETCPNKSARELRRMCEEVLAERQRVVVIDECQHLSNLWHQQLRSLHDHPESQFALLLSGGVNAQKTLKRDQQLESRVAMQITFAPLEGTELLDVLNRLHPVLANTPDELLAEIDHRDCRGNLRRWTTVLEIALGLLPKSKVHDRLTEQVMRAVFQLRGIQ
jgi:type II secretory pathway predicted ATPase ExeA